MKKEISLEEKVNEIIKQHQMPLHYWYGNKIKIGVVTDTQIGSLYERNDFLKDIYKIFNKEKIENVYHCGDICDGEKMYIGQEYELYAHGVDKQVESVENNYPNYKNIKTYFITGNHDLSFFKQSGVDIGTKIAEKRKDLIYLGQEEKDIVFGDKKKVILRLSHPGKGTAYALSYHPQKYIDSLSGGRKPNVLLIGHYHKAEYLPCYRNVFTVQAGCMQSQTPFMRRNNIAAHIGGWILEFQINKYGIQQFKANFIPFYET